MVADDIVSQKFFSIFDALAIGNNIKNQILQAYVRINDSFSLEGDEVHWLCCALYCYGRSCEKDSETEPIASIARLLSISKLNFTTFFSKIRKWIDMANLSSTFIERIENLERSFRVSTVVYNKFIPIFNDIFETVRETNHTRPLTFEDLLKLTWHLYILIKSNFPAIRDDLVNTFHLLLCCIDYMYSNAVHSNHVYLIKAHIFELAPTSILDHLCTMYNGKLKDCMSIKEHWWKPAMKRLITESFKTSVIPLYNSVLSSEHFSTFTSAVAVKYAKYVESNLDMDERIYLDTDCNYETSESSGVKENLMNRFADDSKLKQVVNFEKLPPVQITHQSVYLEALLDGLLPEPSFQLLSFLKECEACSPNVVINRVKEMSNAFWAAYMMDNFSDEEIVSMGRKRLNFIKSLYYKLLESILLSEWQRLGDNAGLLVFNLVMQDVFHKCLFCISSEIVLFSCNCTRLFPWTMDILELSSYDFYKIIEVVVKIESGLTKAVVKHLNSIEETILESHVWQSDSSFWNIVPDTIPSCADVNYSNQLDVQRTLPMDESPLGERPRKIGSLALFFRKVYLLASLRLRDLGERLTVETDILQRMWTVFEHSLVSHTYMLKDRHIDQILMCSCYIVGKVTRRSNWSFHDIMRHYRFQPQASNKVYRSVLIRNSNLSPDNIEHVTRVPNGDFNESLEERGDIIKFYNEVFVLNLQEFSKSLVPNRGPTEILSPLPAIKTRPHSPRCISQTHNVYVSPYKSSSKEKIPNSNGKIIYQFSISPAKNLHEINQLIKANDPKKRALVLEETDLKVIRLDSSLLDKYKTLQRFDQSVSVSPILSDDEYEMDD